MSLKSANASGLNPPAGRALQAGMAEAVVGRALLRIAQDAVRLGRFFELVLAVGSSG